MVDLRGESEGLWACGSAHVNPVSNDVRGPDEGIPQLALLDRKVTGFNDAMSQFLISVRPPPLPSATVAFHPRRGPPGRGLAVCR